MSLPIGRIACAALLLLALLGPVRGDDNRDFFTKPETPADFWRRIQFEVEVGKFDFAAEYMKGMVGALAALKPEEMRAELLKIEEKDGMSAFLRLRNVSEQLDLTKESQAKYLKDEKERKKVLLEVRTARKAMRASADKLIDMVSDALQKERERFKDPNLIQKFIKNLTASPEERAFAISQLQKSREAAVPYLLQELQKTHGSPAHERVYTALLKLDHIAPAMIAGLYVRDNDIRRDILSYINDRNLVSAVPELWYLESAPKLPESIRQQAARSIAALKGIDIDLIPSAKMELTKLAEHYYRHQARFPLPDKVVVWTFDEKKNQIVDATFNTSQAEEFLGLRYARFALDLDPAYRPAQVVFLSLAAEKAYGTDIHLPLKGKVKELMTGVSPALLAEVLDRALRDRRLAVILATLQALGDLRDVRAARESVGGSPVLVRALTYPDRRVQMTAAQALVRVSGRPTPAAAAQVVDIYRRILLAEPKSKVLVAYANALDAELMRRAATQAGFEPVVVKSRVEALNRLKGAADIDAILMGHDFPSAQEFAFTLSEMRADIDVGLLPLIVTVPTERELRLRRFVSRYPNTWAEVVDFGKIATVREESEILTDLNAQMAQLKTKLGSASIAVETIDSVTAQWLAIQTVKVDLKTEKEAIAKLVQDLTGIRAKLKEDKAEQALIDRVIKRLDEFTREKESNAGSINSLGDLKNKIKGYIRDAMGRPLSGAEWTVFKEDALDGLAKMARGNLAGYNIRPAEDAIYGALRSTQVGAVKEALAIVGRLRGPEAQRELAVFVLDPMRDKLRELAASELAGHIQQNGLLLGPDVVKRIKALYADTADPKLKEQLTLVIGSMRPSTTTTGKRLREYQPTPDKPKEPEKPNDKPKEKEKEKEDDFK